MEPGDPATMPLTASAALLLDATLEDFAWRARGGMAVAGGALGPARLEIAGSWLGCTSVVVSSSRSLSMRR